MVLPDSEILKIGALHSSGQQTQRLSLSSLFIAALPVLETYKHFMTHIRDKYDEVY